MTSIEEKKKLHTRLDKKFERIKTLYEKIHKLIDQGKQGGEPAREWLESQVKGEALNVCAGDYALSDSIGIDINPRMLAAELWWNADRLLLGDASVDTVITNYLDALPDTNKALTEWYRVLKPGGRLAVVVRDADQYENELGPFVNPHRFQCFTRRTLTCHLAKAKFKVITWEIKDKEIWMLAEK